MNPAYISALAALAGSLIGGLASIATSWLTQHYQDRAQRQQAESIRREQLFRDFIVQASKLYADALTHELTDVSILVPLYALKAQLGLFASDTATARADEVMQLIIRTYYEPNADFHRADAIRDGSLDVLKAFTEACRAELMG